MSHRLTDRFNTSAVWCAIAMGFAIPISTAASNLLLALTLLLALLAGDWRHKAHIISRSPVALAALAFCALALLGCAWGAGDWADKKHYLVKYLALLIIPLLIPLFGEPRHRQQALAAFVVAMLLTLAISLLFWLDVFAGLPPELIAHIGQGQTPDYPYTQNAVVFKLSITHGFLMAIAAYLLLLGARERTGWQRRGCRVLAWLAAANVLFMIIGRTGYVVLGVLACYDLAARLGRRGMIVAGIACLLLGAAAYQFSGSFHQRIDKAVNEASRWQPGQGDRTSIGLRLDYYRNTLAIIGVHPLQGVGTGGFARSYDERVKGTAMAPSNNPHNQYLLTTAQYGLPGLALLLLLYFTHWRSSRALPETMRHVARGVLLAYLVGNLFNSFMLDFSERLFFAWISGVLFGALPRENENSGTSG
jgi:O-antigen ligase